MEVFKMKAEKEVRAFEITIIKADPDYPSKEGYHKYFLNRPEELSEEEAQELEAFVLLSAKAFRQDFCLRNNLSETEVLTKIAKVTYWSTRRDFN